MLSCAIFSAFVLTACEESPTGPGTLVQSVGGTEWVAVAVPEQLPAMGVWATDPSPEAFLNSYTALNSWTDRVLTEVGAGRNGALDSAVAAVERDLELATEALERADSTTAAAHMAHAGQSVREMGPDRIATELIARVEFQLDRADLDARSLRRAEHLIRAAREAVRADDSMRALRRGLYALQLTAGRGILLTECTSGDEGCGAP